MTSKKKYNITLVCPVCGEEMIEFEYGYDNNVHGKVYFKCEHCVIKKVKFYKASFFYHIV